MRKTWGLHFAYYVTFDRLQWMHCPKCFQMSHLWRPLLIGAIQWESHHLCTADIDQRARVSPCVRRSQIVDIKFFIKAPVQTFRSYIQCSIIVNMNCTLSEGGNSKCVRIYTYYPQLPILPSSWLVSSHLNLSSSFKAEIFSWNQAEICTLIGIGYFICDV